MVYDGAADNGRSFKHLIYEFRELREQSFLRQNKSPTIPLSLEQIRNTLLAKLQDKKMQSRLEIDKAELKKRNLIKRLVYLEKINDTAPQDDIIKELEEYSKVRRYHDAQLARVAKEIEDVNLTENQYQDKVKQQD